jgi:predicted esterase
MTSLRVLALHGYRQSGDALNKSFGFLRKDHTDVEFFFPDGPHIFTHSMNGDLLSPDKPQQRAWWNSSDDGKHYKGLRESILHLNQIVKEHGPFDGVIGFSQGAFLTTILCSLQQLGTLIPPLPNIPTNELRDLPSLLFQFRFAILIGGRLPRDEYVLKYLIHPFTTTTSLLNISTLHIFGEKDFIVPADESVDLSKIFESPIILRHKNGHLLPSDKDSRSFIQNYLNEQRKRHKEQI